MKFKHIYGVDFSGAKNAGDAIWIAHAQAFSRERLTSASSVERRRALKLVDLQSLSSSAGTSEREPSLEHLVKLIAQSQDALWALDFPFGLPIELFDQGIAWSTQLEVLRGWNSGAYDFGIWCVERTRKLLNRMHVRRTTDVDAKTPFDCYHYRIVYQMFHGMRDVLLPLARHRGTAILPFGYRKLDRAQRVMVEACPSSTLKRLSAPHQNYKQPAGGPLTSIRRRTRHKILDLIQPYIEISEQHRRTIMRNGGGDALDAVIAAVGAQQSFAAADHEAIARHARYPREGRLYA